MNTVQNLLKCCEMPPVPSRSSASSQWYGMDNDPSPFPSSVEAVCGWQLGQQGRPATVTSPQRGREKNARTARLTWIRTAFFAPPLPSQPPTIIICNPKLINPPKASSTRARLHLALQQESLLRFQELLISRLLTPARHHHVYPRPRSAVHLAAR
jgi:hypothetical protein